MSALRVWLNAIEVGVLEHFDDESESFTFAEQYLDAHIDARPILGQLFEDRIPKSIHVGGPIGWFDHLLPQGAMRRWRSRLLGIDESDGFSLLTNLRENLPGAVILTPTESLLHHRSEKKSDSDPLRDEGQPFRFSLAGAQWKLSARPSGRGLTTNATAHGTEYIAKFHSPEYPDLPRCEFATMQWAQKSGIQRPHSNYVALRSSMPCQIKCPLEMAKSMFASDSIEVLHIGFTWKISLRSLIVRLETSSIEAATTKSLEFYSGLRRTLWKSFCESSYSP